MFRALLIATCLFLVSVQVKGGSELQSLQDEVEGINARIGQEGQLAKDKLKKGLEDLRVRVHDGLQEKIANLINYFDRAIQEVDSLPQNCRGDSKMALEKLKSSNIGDFLHCPGIVPAGVDMMAIFDLTVEFVFDIIFSFIGLADGFVKCIFSFWPWKIASCLIEEISTVGDVVYQIGQQGELFVSVVEEYSHNITVILDWCWNNSSAVEDVLAILTPLHACAEKQVPSHLYKLS